MRTTSASLRAMTWPFANAGCAHRTARSTFLQRLEPPPRDSGTWGDIPPHLRGGGDTWIPGAYDPDLDLFFIGTAQAKPWVAASRGMSTYNDALYTNSTLALNPRTGQVAWYFQHVPGETLDLDIVFERVLVDVDDHKWLFTAGKDAILWKLDRRTGAFVDLAEMLHQNIFESIDLETGRVSYRQDIRDAGVDDAVDACPSLYGGHNWQASGYSPEAKVIIYPLHQVCMTLTGRRVELVEGGGGLGVSAIELHEMPARTACSDASPRTTCARWRRSGAASSAPSS